MNPDPTRTIKATRVGDLKVAHIRPAELIEGVVHRIRRRNDPLMIAYANAWTVGLARSRRDYAAALNQERRALVYADGQAVVWASAFLGDPLPGRVNAGDFWFQALERFEREGVSVYLLGGPEGLAEETASRLSERFPHLTIAGASDGYFAPEQEPALAERIATGGADVVFVGMGSPRQELWANRWLDTLGAPVVWCVGALFEYYGGRRGRAPVWMRRCGLEWLFRLALEPGRLWRRYLLGNPRFLWITLSQKCQSHRQRGRE